MSKVYNGDEWKQEAPGAKKRPRTRAEEQHHINLEYAEQRITRAEWSRRFDELSDVRAWSAEGRIL